MLVVLAITGALCAAAGAQIEANETGLHDGESVYGLYLTSDPYVNPLSIVLFAWGETNPNMYTDVRFSAYGLYSEPNLINTGAIGVNATGGNAATNSGDALAYMDEINGIRTRGNAHNAGSITITASGGTTASSGGTGAASTPLVEGIHAGGDANNMGTITVSATAGTADSSSGGAYASIFEAAGVYAGRDIYNAGDITITATGGTANSAEDAFASVYAVGLEAPGGSVNSAGTLSIAARGGSAVADGHFATASAEVTAYGINSDANIDNTGPITATAIGGIATARTPSDDPGATAYADTRAEAYGLLAQSNVSNSGSIMATATGGAGTASTGSDAYTRTKGIFAVMSVTNSGRIRAVATGGTAGTNGTADAHSTAFGIDSRTVNNSGDLIVSANGGAAEAHRGASTPPNDVLSANAQAEAWGIDGAPWGDLTNTSAITVAATGGTANGDDSADAHSYARGIAASRNMNNTGVISVTAIGGTAVAAAAQADAKAYGIASGGGVNNSGAITAAAAAQEGFTSYAYGIFMDSTGHLTNTGIVRATADTAYEVYVASGTTTLVDIYNVTLDGDPSRASLGVADGARLALNQATLTVTPVSGETRWNTEYKLFEAQGTGVVEGSFGDVRAVNPNTTATYHDQGTAGSVDDTVSLAYTPVAAPGLASAGVEKQTISRSTDVVNDHMTTALLQRVLFASSAGLLASAGSTEENLALAGPAFERSQGVFAEPYYSSIDKDADPLGFTARLWGFSAGYERLCGNTLAGLHFGYGRSDIEYTGTGYSANSEDQDIVTGGFHGLTTWDPWTLRYGLTGFYGWHNYQGLTGLALDTRETASYDSYGTATMLMAGRIFRWGPHAVLPEAGLNWLWTHRAGYTTEATSPSWNTTYSATDDHDLHAAFALRWLSSFRMDDIGVTPSVAVALRHLLTDAHTSAWQSVPGAAPVLVRSEQDRTALTLSGSLGLTLSPHALSLAYDGSYAARTHQHSVWLRYSWLF